MIKVKLNLTKINKDRIFTSEKGNKFLDIILIETPNGQYGDWIVNEDVKKEEREAGIKGNILGNGKNFGSGGGGSQSNSGGDSSGGKYTDMPY